MLREIRKGGIRRLFSDDYFDLYVWEKANKVYRFQLCYDKYGVQRAITWTNQGELSHTKVDEDNEKGKYKMSPILVANGVFDKNSVAELFNNHAKEIDSRIASVVYRVLQNYSTPLKQIE